MTTLYITLNYPVIFGIILFLLIAYHFLHNAITYNYVVISSYKIQDKQLIVSLTSLNVFKKTNPVLVIDLTKLNYTPDFEQLATNALNKKRMIISQTDFLELFT